MTTSPARLDVVSAEAHCRRLAAAGAIMTVPGNPDRRFLVGHFEWLASNRIFWFNANGSDDGDANVLEFDRVTGAADEIGFIRAGKLVGHLVPIETARVADPDDYRIAWQIWQQVAPMLQAKIQQLASRHEVAANA